VALIWGVHGIVRTYARVSGAVQCYSMESGVVSSDPMTENEGRIICGRDEGCKRYLRELG
jgi:hypothetical protein